jgi:two-component system response regulator AtoC
MGFSMELARDRESLFSFLHGSEHEIAALVIDANSTDGTIVATLRSVREMEPDLPVIVYARQPSTEQIVEAMKSGATEFLSAPINRDVVTAVLSRVLENKSVGSAYGNPLPDETDFFIGPNSRIAEIYGQIGRIAHAKVAVLIQGETGSGKEVLARAIHCRSPRAHRPFLKLNCAALPSELVESELFGYERGAFTGAFKRKEGMFELANGGTLLLDEIGDMDFRLQAKLLQVLQDREFRRIGGKETVKVDVRVIAATHRDLEQAIQDRAFREDLYYRLNVVNLIVPALRDRKEDIIPTAEFLINRHAVKKNFGPKISPELKHAMMTYDWPGNVRELENNVRKLIVFNDCDLLVRDLRARTLRKQSTGARSVEASLPVPILDPAIGFSGLDEARRAKERAETDVILSALNSTRWNRKQAAKLLEIDYKSLLYKMKKLGLENSPTQMALPDQALRKLQTATGG